MSLLANLFGRNSQPRPQLDHNDPSFHEMKAALHALDAMPLTEKEDVERWYVAAEAFRKRLGTEWSSLNDSPPHELDHYLSDADIRARDANYSTYQWDILAESFALEGAPQPSAGVSDPERA